MQAEPVLAGHRGHRGGAERRRAGAASAHHPRFRMRTIDGEHAVATVLTADARRPAGYGRIVRDAEGSLLAHRRAQGRVPRTSAPSARSIRGCSASTRTSCFRRSSGCTRRNAQNEYLPHRRHRAPAPRRADRWAPRGASTTRARWRASTIPTSSTPCAGSCGDAVMMGRLYAPWRSAYLMGEPDAGLPVLHAAVPRRRTAPISFSSADANWFVRHQSLSLHHRTSDGGEQPPRRADERFRPGRRRANWSNCSRAASARITRAYDPTESTSAPTSDAARAPGSSDISTCTWCRAGTGTRTSCRRWERRGSSRRDLNDTYDRLLRALREVSAREEDHGQPNRERSETVARCARA